MKTESHISFISKCGWLPAEIQPRQNKGTLWVAICVREYSLHLWCPSTIQAMRHFSLAKVGKLTTVLSIRKSLTTMFHILIISCLDYQTLLFVLLFSWQLPNNVSRCKSQQLDYWVGQSKWNIKHLGSFLASSRNSFKRLKIQDSGWNNVA